MIAFWRRKPQAQPVAATGVGVFLTASHRPPHSVGPIHEHVWEIKAWFRDYRGDAEFLQKQLADYLARYQGEVLPDALARGEDLARAVHGYMTDDYYGQYCWFVTVERAAEMIYARWPA